MLKLIYKNQKQKTTTTTDEFRKLLMCKQGLSRLHQSVPARMAGQEYYTYIPSLKVS